MASVGGMFRDGYPVGMRVLAVDADPVALTTLKQMLQRCGYLAMAKTSAEDALREVRENPEGFDLVMTELHTRGRIDGFGLLKHVKDQLPVVMFSADEATETVRRGIEEGSCGYLQKPLRMQEIRNIWQHVVRRKLNATPGEGANALPRQDYGDNDVKTARKRGGDDDDSDEGSDTAQGRKKKPKSSFQWCAQPHELFVKAVIRLKGKEEITPKRLKKILEQEGVQVTQDQVASHLQKYRKDCQNAELSAKTSSSHANSYKNYVTPQDIEESFAIYMRSQGSKIGHGSIIRQTSLQLRDDEPSVGCGVLGNGSWTASHGGVLTNDEILVSAVARAIKGTTSGHGGHGGVLTNQSLVTASLPSNLAQPQQPVSSGFPTNFISTYDRKLAQPHQPMSSGFPTNYISTYDPNLAQPQQPMSSGFPINFISTCDQNLAQPYQAISSDFPTNFISTYDPNLAQPQQPMSSSFPTNLISTCDPNLAQPQQPMSYGFPTNFLSTYDPNPVAHEGFPPQTSQLSYVDDSAMLPWSELDDLDDDLLMSSSLGGDEVKQDARTLDIGQAMHDLDTTGEIRALQPEGLNSGFFSWESIDGTAGTSGGGGVSTDGMMANQFDDELERFINL